MQALTERARQAFGLGSDVFVASNLDAHEATIKELGDFAAPLKAIEKATGQFNQDTAEFLQATATLITSCPFPRMWAQPSPTEPAVPVHMPAPSDAAAWLDADTHELLAGEAPGAVKMAVKKELLAPMQQWLAAYDVAQAQLSSLQSGRLTYDATRRHLVTAAARAAKDAAEPASPRSSTAAAAFAGTTAAPAAVAGGGEEEGGVKPPDVLLMSSGPQLAQLQEVAAATGTELAEYEAKVEALDDTLAWLAGGAARIKAALADAGGSAAAAANSWQVPHGLLPPLQDKSSIGKDVDITMVMTDTPRSAEVAAAQVASSVGSTQAGDAAITLQLKEGGSSSSGSASSAGTTGAGGRSEQQHGSPDLSAMLPKDDAMVYGGGVPPSPTATSHHPSGGGPAQYVKDTLTGPAAAEGEEREGEGGSSSSGGAGGLPAADLSSILPRDDAAVYGGGVAPSPMTSSHRPTGGGPAQYIKDTLAGPADTSADTPATATEPTATTGPAADLSSAGSSLSTDEQLADELFNDPAEAAEAPADLPNTAAAAPEVLPRPSRRYSGDGVGQHEAGPAAAAQRSGSGGLHFGRAYSGPGLAMQPDVKVANPERKQLSTVVLPASGEQSLQAAAEVAAAHDMPFSGAAATDTTTASGDSSGGDASGGGGLLAAIARTVEGGGSQLKKLVGSAFLGEQQHDEQHDEQQQQEQGDAEEEVPSESSGVKFEVQGADAAGAPGAPGTPSSSGAVELQATPGSEMHCGPVAPSPGHQPSPASAEFVKGRTPPGGAAAAGETGEDWQEEQHRLAAEAGTDMHIGPVAPSPGHQPSPGSAEFVKGPTPPGGAAASSASGPSMSAGSGNEQQQQQHGLAGAAAGSEMHIGPVVPFPGHQASPGSADFVKGPTAPGGAAAAAEAPAGDATTPTAHPADSASKAGGSSSIVTTVKGLGSEAGSDAGSEGKSTASSTSRGPDLSTMLPTYDQLPAGGRKAKPAGGGVGALIRDTLLGPPSDE